MKVLGLDPGTNLGWALRTREGVTASGVELLKVARNEGAGVRWIRLRRFLESLIEREAVTMLVYEQSGQLKGQAAREVYGGIVAIVQQIAEERGRHYSTVHWAHVKRLATGKGNADKRAMTEAAARRWPAWARTQKAPINDNEADARWIAETAWSHFAPPAALTPTPPPKEAKA